MQNLSKEHRSFKALWAALAVSLGLLGCSGEGETLPGMQGGASDGGVLVGPCEPGATHSCHETIARANGTASCWEGTQQCEDGKWGACVGQLTKRPDLRDGSVADRYRALSLSPAPAKCLSDPCDPDCWMFDEDPNPDYTTTSTSGTPSTPTIPDWSAPAGEAPCGHGLCEEDVALDPSCHPCVATVCGIDPTCCSDAWDAACVQLVADECVPNAVPPSVSVCDYGVYSQNGLSAQNGSRFYGGPIGSGQTSGNSVSLNGTIVHSVKSAWNVFLDNTTVQNDVTAGGPTIGKQNAVTIGGTQTVNASLEFPSIPTRNISCLTLSGSLNLNSGTATINAGDARTITLSNSSVVLVLSGPGDYGYLNFNASATVVFAQPGTYTFRGLWMGANAPKLLMPPTGTVNVDVCDQLEFQNGAQVTTWTQACPAYDPAPLTYSTSSIVQQGGNLYQCAVPGLCDLAAYQPGVAAPWDDAWDLFTTVSCPYPTLTCPAYAPPPVTHTTSSIVAHGGNLYRCAVPGWCDIGGIYEPGVGSSWDDAWDLYTTPTCPYASCPAYAVAPITYTTSTIVAHGGSNYQCTVPARCDIGGIYEPGVGSSWTGAWSLYPSPTCPYSSTGSVPDPFSLQWYTNDTDVKIGPGALASGVLIAPNAHVHAYSGGTLKGLIYAKQFTGEPGVVIDATGLIGQACRDANIDPALDICPVELGIPETPPAVSEPCQSGLDCQVNQRCTEVATGATCAHSKCDVGARLNATCDPCVDMICDVDPTCCTGSGNAWDADCVGMVKTVCDAWCGDPIGVLCAHDMCTVSATPLAAACDPCVQQVCADTSSCCSAAWTQDCVDKVYELCGSAMTPPPPVGSGNNACDYAILSSGAIAAYAATINGGDIGGGTGSNSISLDWGVRPQITGNIYSQGAMSLTNSDVTGAVRAGGALTTTGSTVSGGAMGSTSPIPSAAIPTKTITCPTGGTNQTLTDHTTLVPGTYGTVEIGSWGGRTLTLQAGEYNLSSLRVFNGSVIALPATGNVILNVCGRVSLEGSTTMTGISAGSDALRFQVYSASTAATGGCGGSAICIDGSSTVYGSYRAPSGGGYMGTSVRLYGFLHASTVSIYQNAQVQAAGTTGSACVAAGLGTGGGAAACPVITATTLPREDDGACTENALAFTDSSCGARPDLALGMSCDNNVEVCNHGPVPAPAGAVITLFPRSGQQFATTSPDPSWVIGQCVVGSAVPAGQCVSVACDAALFDQDLTMMVETDAATTECSLLDNWSLYDSTQTCTVTTTNEVEEEYAAVCPNNTHARWGVLAWDTITPTTSSITWEARVAETQAGLALEPYQAIGTSRLTPDTQDCPRGSSCDVDLTEAFWGPSPSPGVPSRRNQPQFLELRIRLNPDGVSAPTLREWWVTYTCVDDE